MNQQSNNTATTPTTLSSTTNVPTATASNVIDNDDVIIGGIGHLFDDAVSYLPTRASIDRNLAPIIESEERERSAYERHHHHHHQHHHHHHQHHGSNISSSNTATDTDEESRSFSSRYYEYKLALADILERPRSSLTAKIWNLFVIFLIFASVVFLIVESYPSQYKKSVWWICETVIVAFFTLEYCLRLYATCNSVREVWNFVRKWMNIVDLLSFLPFYVEIILELASLAFDHSLIDIGLFRVLRLVRIFRLVRITQVQILLLSIRKSADVLFAITMYMIIGLLITSTVVYYVERGKFDPKTRQFLLPDGVTPSPFQNIPVSLWWALVSMTTTGYGDMTPATAFGKIVGGISILVGVLVIALPSVIIGRRFGELSSQYKMKLKMDQKRRQRMERESQMDASEIRLAQETDLINALSKHERLLAEQMARMIGVMEQANETREMIRAMMSNYGGASSSTVPAPSSSSLQGPPASSSLGAAAAAATMTGCNADDSTTLTTATTAATVDPVRRSQDRIVTHQTSVSDPTYGTMSC